MYKYMVSLRNQITIYDDTLNTRKHICSPLHSKYNHTITYKITFPNNSKIKIDDDNTPWLFSFATLLYKKLVGFK